MTSDRKLKLFEIYGSDPARWPAEERALFFERTDDAAMTQARRAALTLDRALDAYTVAPADRDLKAAVLAIPGRIGAADRAIASTRNASAGSWTATTFRRMLPHATALLAASVLGVIVGVSDLFPDAGLGVTYDASAVVLGANGMEVFDL